MGVAVVEPLGRLGLASHWDSMYFAGSDIDGLVIQATSSRMTNESSQGWRSRY